MPRYLTISGLAGQSTFAARNIALAKSGRTFSGWELKPSHINEQQMTSSVLQGRLEEILVFELDEQGHTQYRHMSVRALYKYVLATITKPFHKDTASFSTSPKERSQSADREGEVGGEERQVTFDIPVVDAAAATRFAEHEGDITYRERLGGWLHPRDMRRLVTPFSASNEPDVIVRRHVMLLNFDPLRAIILRDRLLVLVPEGADSILIQLEQRIRGGKLEVENSIFGSEFEEGANDNAAASVTASDGHHGAVANSDGLRSTQDTLYSSADSPKQKKKILEDLLTKPLSKSDQKGTKSDRETDTESDGNSEWEEMQANDWINLPFELQAADSVLYVVGSILSQDAYQLQEDTLGYIQDILNSPSGLEDDPLNGIRHIKDAIREMSSRIKGFVQSMNRVLDDDEDMALMNLTRLRTHPHRFLKPVAKEILDEEADEPELILEAHLQIGLTLQNALDLIQGQIDTASELIDQKLDASRNRLLFTNMVLNLLTLCVTMGTFIAGVFGMNLHNHLEESDYAFSQVVWGTFGGMIISLLLLIWGLVWLGIMPRSIFRVGRF